MPPLAPGQKPVAGRISDEGFGISKKDSSGNSWRAEASGAFLPDGSTGTRIVVRLGMNRWVIGLMLLWFTGVSFGAILSLLGLVVAFGSGDRGVLPWLLIMPGMFASGVVFRLYGLSSYRGQAGFLLRFLRETLEAEEEERPTLPL